MVTLVQVISLLDLAVVVSHLDSAMPRPDVIHAKFVLVVFVLLDHILVRNVQRRLQIDHNGIKKMLCALLSWSQGHAFQRCDGRAIARVLCTLILDTFLLILSIVRVG